MNLQEARKEQKRMNEIAKKYGWWIKEERIDYSCGRPAFVVSEISIKNRKS